MVDYMHPLAAPFHLPGSGGDAILMLHGWTGSPAHLRPLAGELSAVGYTVAAPLLAGHGTHIEDMVTTGWRDWMRSALEVGLALGTDHDRVHLIGLSMGGVMSILLAPVLEATSLVTINAPQKVWDKRSRFAHLVRGSDRIQPSDSPVPAPPELLEYQQQYQGTPVGTAAELNDLVNAARRNLFRVECPALVIQSRADETVRPVSGEIIYDGLGSSEKGLVWLERSRHVALLDAERDVIQQVVMDHLARHSQVGTS